MIIAIDASRNRSGGTVAHLDGIIKNLASNASNDLEVHLWSYSSCLDSLPDRTWLTKHRSSYLNRSIFHQLFWQRFILPSLLVKLNCQILFNTTASSICTFKPSITLSQDMLAFDKIERKRFGISLARIRLAILKRVYTKALRRSNRVIFLSQYAAENIQSIIGKIPNSVVIPHGCPESFKIERKKIKKLDIKENKPIRIIYVSEITNYKHQVTVFHAIQKLNFQKKLFEINFVGGGKGKYLKILMNQVKKYDPRNRFTKFYPFLEKEALKKLISDSDIFLFASSCENLPITLLEGMVSGKPIASSNRGPMKEILGDSGYYFDPENVESIKSAILSILDDPEEALQRTLKSYDYSSKYNWLDCAAATFNAVRLAVDEHIN